jgi:hypothetical protein
MQNSADVSPQICLPTVEQRVCRDIVEGRLVLAEPIACKDFIACQEHYVLCSFGVRSLHEAQDLEARLIQP